MVSEAVAMSVASIVLAAEIVASEFASEKHTTGVCVLSLVGTASLVEDKLSTASAESSGTALSVTVPLTAAALTPAAAVAAAVAATGAGCGVAGGVGSI